MNTTPALGIDMASTTFVAVLWLSPQQAIKQEFANSPGGWRKLGTWLKRHGAPSVRAALESTSTYGEGLLGWLHEHGQRVYLLNPERVLRYAQCRGQRNKTDPADAHTIAEFLARHEELTPWLPPPPEQKTLRELMRTRAQLVAHGKQITNQLKTATPQSAPFLKALLQTVRAQLLALARALQAHLRAHPPLERQVRQLMTIQGIGLVTAATALAELPPITPHTDARSISAWAGLTPHRWQSGHSERPARLSRRGNAHLRQTLFMPALVAKRCNPLLHAFALRLHAKGKSNLSILGAIAHKLLRIIVGLLKSNSSFDPNWSFKKA